MKNLNLNMSQMLTREQMKMITGRGRSGDDCLGALCFGAQDDCSDSDCYCSIDEPVMGLPGAYVCNYVV